MAFKTWLVTGGCGFIGSHVVDVLLKAGDRVKVLDNLSTGFRDNVPTSAELIVGDVRHARAVTDAMEGVAGCFHLAAVASVQRCQEDWLASHNVNVGGLINILDASRSTRTPVVYASSSAIYGANCDLPLKETAQPDPLSFYAADKLTDEHQVRIAARLLGIPSAGLRLFNVYGPRQQPSSPYSGVISIFAKRILEGSILPIHGDGQQTRDFVHVEDVAAAFLAAMRIADCAAPICNVCTGTATSLLRLVEIIEGVVNRRAVVEMQPARAGDVRFSQGSPGLLMELTDWSPRVSLEQGLKVLLGGLASARRQATARRVPE
jgi:UDP-glucose 4-epimerase